MDDGPGGLGSHNLPFIEGLYAQYRQDPGSVDAGWAAYFEGMEAGEEGLNGVRLGPSFARRSIFNPPEGDLPALASEVLDEALRPVASLSGPDLAARVPFLRSLAMFQDLPEAELAEVARIAREVAVEDGRTFVREGEMGRDMYIVTEGLVVVGRGGRMVAELGPGEVVGEMAVLDSQPRSADATAVGQVRLLRISAKDLRDTLERRPVLASGIIRVLTRRLRDSGSRQDRVDQLIRAYRVRGHLLADLDPLGLPKEVYPELNPAYYGFQQQDLDMLFSSTTIPGRPVMRLRDIIAHLRKTYCRSSACSSCTSTIWRSRTGSRPDGGHPEPDHAHPRAAAPILTKLTDAEIFEQFIHKKFVGAKRFSLEGGESLIPLLDLASRGRRARRREKSSSAWPTAAA
jgi:2-oxoglutarate dehydrogenase complex dehydrogenase (E1) component-like enzyme